MEETVQKRRPQDFKPGQSGNPDTQFSSDQDHLTEAKKKGWSKKKLLKDLLGIVTSGKLGTSLTDYRKLTADYLGIKEESVTIKMIMDFRQIEKAILKGDTSAYSAIMDRAYGKPAQAFEHSGPGGQPIEASVKYDLSKLSDDELRTIAEMQRKAGVSSSSPT